MYANLDVRTWKTKAGNQLEAVTISSERYAWDFTQCKLGWLQYDTDQDAWYYGVWYHPGKRQTVSYTEGDIYLVTCDSWESFVAEMKNKDEFHGGPPPAIVAADRISIDLKLVNAVAYYDPEARMDYNMPPPEKEEPIDIKYVSRVFLGLYKEKEHAEEEHSEGSKES